MATTVTLQVEGMDCANCEQRLGTALRRLEGVSEATADYRSGEVVVRFDPAVTTQQAVAERVETAGYTVAGTTPSS
ncbi:heavy-metal-associated domain-containing protein [Kocuria sp. CPCC 205297]|uniref:heavy-metal-associated domain-containing protein n=1 Tax=Kocuria sp. CPCC 205297 TaxID=3073558 RepID=UPI0034D4E817